MCLKALDWIVCLEGCPEVSEQLQTWFCGVTFGWSGTLAEPVSELSLPPVDFVPEPVSAAQRELPGSALIECPINAACTF